MKSKTSVLFICAFSAALAGCGGDNAGLNNASLVITDVAIVDVETGLIKDNQSIIIGEGRILDILSSDEFEPRKGTRVVDGAGKYAMPGLWDMHVHLTNDEPPVAWDHYTPGASEVDQQKTYLPVYVAFGVTGVRELSGGVWSLKMRDEVEAGKVYGPHQIIGSPILDGPHPIFPGAGVRAIADPVEARQAVKELHALGYDFLKTYNFLSPDSYKAIHETAKSLGMEVSGEMPLGVSVWEAAHMGHRTIEHLTGVDLACSSREEELRAHYSEGVAKIAADSSSKDQLALWNRSEWEPIGSFDPEKCKRLYALLATENVWVVPTLVIQRMISYPDLPFVRDNPNHKYVTKYDTDPDGVIEQFDPDRRLRPTYDHRASVIGDLQDAGVGILAGSDLQGAYVLHEELKIFVEGGLTPAEALQTATINPAKYLGKQDELGSIAPGKIADIVLLTANPLSDINNTLSIDGVILKGRYHDRTLLDRFLEKAEKDARAWENEG